MNLKLDLRGKRRLRALQVACVLALIGLGLIVWSVIDPRPLPVIIGMSVAQGIGTLSLFIFALVVLSDLRRAHVFEDDPDEKK